jgi:hypothetical protein
MTFASRHISIAINCPVGEVYEFACNPENLPRWAAGLSSSIGMVDDEWVAETAAGPVRVRFAERNEFGVLDHHVITASGESIYNPLRVLGNGDGAEVVFTLYRREGMDESAFDADAAAVDQDLHTLKRLLEA